MPMNIDLKDTHNSQLVQKVSELIMKYNRQDITIWGSFNERFSQEMHRHNDKIPMFYSAPRMFKTYLLLWTGLLPFVGLGKPKFLQMPMATEGYFKHKMKFSKGIF